MIRPLQHIILLFALVLWNSCKKDDTSATENDGNMQLVTRSGEDSGSNNPCFIFWKETDYIKPAFISGTPLPPYVCCYPTGVIDDYATVKYNTRYVYPPYTEWVFAVGISPGSIVPDPNSDWKTFLVPPAIAGLADIQCAPVIAGNEQTPFSNPLKFGHQLTRIEISGFCGDDMADGVGYINVKDIKITLSSETDNQWGLFPEKLTWDYGTGNNGQYKVTAYTVTPSSPITTTVSSLSTTILYGATDNTKEEAKPIGNFYLVPGFNEIKVNIEATYIDSTTDGLTLPDGNGQEIKRVWNNVLIDGIHPGTIVTPTSAGESYSIKLEFEKSKIILNVTLKDWETEIIS